MYYILMNARPNLDGCMCVCLFDCWLACLFVVCLFVCCCCFFFLCLFVLVFAVLLASFLACLVAHLFVCLFVCLFVFKDRCMDGRVIGWLVLLCLSFVLSSFSRSLSITEPDRTKGIKHLNETEKRCKRRVRDRQRARGSTCRGHRR